MYALIDDVEVQIQELEIKIEGLKNRDITVEKILESLLKISELFDDMNDEERRILVSKLIKSINFDSDRMIKMYLQRKKIRCEYDMFTITYNK